MLEEGGLKQLNLRALAARAGITAGSMYHHYESKTELLGELAAGGFKELRLDNQSGALNSFVRVGPSANGQGQGSAESRSTGSGTSGTGSPGDRRSPELFKLGGNVKF